jgi:hypothetical protein
MKAFSKLTPREILAVAISSEEEDARIVITQPLVRQIDSMRVKSVASGVRM